MRRRSGRVKPGRPARDREHCMNPWNGNCGSTDIQLYIWYRDRKLPICRKCWEKISEADFEWGDEREALGRLGGRG